MSLQGGLERPLCEAVKEKPGFPWRSQEVRDARTVEYLLKRAANRERNQLKRNKVCYIQVDRAERSWRTEESFDIKHGDAEFGLCSVLFWSSIFSLCSFSLHFGMVLYIWAIVC